MSTCIMHMYEKISASRSSCFFDGTFRDTQTYVRTDVHTACLDDIYQLYQLRRNRAKRTNSSCEPTDGMFAPFSRCNSETDCPCRACGRPSNKRDWLVVDLPVNGAGLWPTGQQTGPACRRPVSRRGRLVADRPENGAARDNIL